MAELIGILFFAVVSILFLRFFGVIKRITLFEYEKGLCYKRGKFTQILEPGVYWYIGPITTIQKYDVRKHTITIPGQEVLTLDGIVIKLSFLAEYDFHDLANAINRYENYYAALYADIQTATRTVVGNLKAEELLEKRNEISKQIVDLVTEKAHAIGLTLHLLDIKDIMFPGALKDIFAQVVKAQKQAQAELEKARGQTASLRHLANAAKMIDNNPSLLNLRLIQAVSEGTGNTVVLKMAGDASPEISS